MILLLIYADDSTDLNEIDDETAMFCKDKDTGMYFSPFTMLSVLFYVHKYRYDVISVI